MTIKEHHLEEIATEAWSSLLDRDLVHAATISTALPAGAEVVIGGAWDGRIRIETSQALAREATAALFGLPEDEIDDELIADAIGELANIIGGNIKALLPSPSHLGLPRPIEGEATDIVAEVALSDGEQPVSITVERLPPGGGAGSS